MPQVSPAGATNREQTAHGQTAARRRQAAYSHSHRRRGPLRPVRPNPPSTSRYVSGTLMTTVAAMPVGNRAWPRRRAPGKSRGDGPAKRIDRATRATRHRPCGETRRHAQEYLVTVSKALSVSPHSQRPVARPRLLRRHNPRWRPPERRADAAPPENPVPLSSRSSHVTWLRSRLFATMKRMRGPSTSRVPPRLLEQ
jgi:hypothetical protein